MGKTVGKTNNKTGDKTNNKTNDKANNKAKKKTDSGRKQKKLQLSYCRDLSGFPENLANAIILQAVYDYRMSCKLLREPSLRLMKGVHSRPGDYLRAQSRLRQAVRLKRECESFFRGRWIRQLTQLDGRALLGMLRSEEREKDERARREIGRIRKRNKMQGGRNG